MKKMLKIIVPLAMLVGFASIGLAADEGTPDLNRELNDDIRSDVAGGTASVTGEDVVIDDNTYTDTVDPNVADAREARTLVAKRGRQPRRGQTASDLSDVQKYWGRHHEGDDEGADEDEDGDMTPYGN
jgi:hypothetical protein